MKCCGSCFADRFLKDRIDYLSKDRGLCEICGTEDAALIEATALADDFEQLCGIYEPDEDGRPLIDWLIGDWTIFDVRREQAMRLLGDILNDAKRAREPCEPQGSGTHDNLGNWRRLRDELRHRNRFSRRRESMMPMRINCSRI